MIDVSFVRGVLCDVLQHHDNERARYSFNQIHFSKLFPATENFGHRY